MITAKEGNSDTIQDHGLKILKIRESCETTTEFIEKLFELGEITQEEKVKLTEEMNSENF